MPNASNWFFRLAVLYFIAGVCLGIYMAASQNHTMHPVHAHLNLLGWVSLALFGTFYRLWPEAAKERLALIQFWLFVPAHFVMMMALFALFRGVTAVEPILAVTSIIVGLSVVCFAVLVWKHTATAPRTEKTIAGFART